ncbi:hypothetical protein ACQP25_17795 [Microtetraspora malaysiensis]|uniref:hypothetical protein n=1 Tax=Microtetraspora malaysiensis TaxID=161358 RepID=UPI003D8AE554
MRYWSGEVALPGTRPPGKVGFRLAAAAFRWTACRPGFQAWQRQAWAYYDSTPEMRYAATWIGNAMS